jgi:hypothetical protein
MNNSKHKLAKNFTTIDKLGYKVEERPTRPAHLHASPPMLSIVILEVGPRWSPSTSLLLHLYLGVEGCFPPPFYRLDRSVPGGGLHGNTRKPT